MEYTIKQVTEKYNLSASTLRYYEKEGLLPKIKKNQSNKRIYDDNDLQWLDIIIMYAQNRNDNSSYKRLY